MKIAKNFKLSWQTKKKSLQTIGHIFWSLQCAPVDFLNTFTYHPNNEFFDEIEFTQPETNSVIRAKILSGREMHRCVGDKTMGSIQYTSTMEGLSRFLSYFNDNVNDLADDLAMSKSGKFKKRFTLEELMGDVTIGGSEISNAGNDLLGVPTGINGVWQHEIGAGNAEMFYLLNGQVPRANVAIGTIRDEMGLIDGRLMKQQAEADHLEKSRIYKKALKYVLQPTALERQNFWQSRGADIPKWFPGLYTVFQDSFNLNPALQSSPSSALLHAWRTMAPLVETAS